MAVTTEPPWTNVSSGTADRNGTTSHTIPFGFTTATDSLVVVVVFGGVTHTVSGWTEQLSPVSSGELSVFTKVSTGDADITVTHNASNYPVQWVAYEFPEGSTYTAGQSNNASDETFPDLAGLPGVEQVVIAARGRIAGGSESGASTTWTGPWVEDVDLFTANGATDGCYLTVGHQINVTATSITPSASTTYDGTWGIGDREKVVFALDVEVGASTINGTASATGAGVATAVAVQRAGSSPAGAGAVTALATQRGTASPTGAGVATALVVQRAAAAAVGAGVATASAVGTITGTASAVGAGTATASGAVMGSASAVGAGTVSAAVTVQAGATATGAGAATATSQTVIVGTASAIGAGVVAAIAGSRITPRPFTGTTLRPFSGITTRP